MPRPSIICEPLEARLLKLLLAALIVWLVIRLVSG
jgi:hypothetical protein